MAEEDGRRARHISERKDTQPRAGTSSLRPDGWPWPTPTTLPSASPSSGCTSTWCGDLDRHPRGLRAPADPADLGATAVFADRVPRAWESWEGLRLHRLPSRPRRVPAVPRPLVPSVVRKSDPGSSSNPPGDLHMLLNVPVTQRLCWRNGNNPCHMCHRKLRELTGAGWRCGSGQV